jgi:hypothetical protein
VRFDIKTTNPTHDTGAIRELWRPNVEMLDADFDSFKSVRLAVLLE